MSGVNPLEGICLQTADTSVKDYCFDNSTLRSAVKELAIYSMFSFG
jgi:hypothetical protein